MDYAENQELKQVNIFGFLGLILGVMSAFTVNRSFGIIFIVLAAVSSIISLVTYDFTKHTKNSRTYAITGLALSIVYLTVILHIWRYIDIPFY